MHIGHFSCNYVDSWCWPVRFELSFCIYIYIYIFLYRLLAWIAERAFSTSTFICVFTLQLSTRAAYALNGIRKARKACMLCET